MEDEIEIFPSIIERERTIPDTSHTHNIHVIEICKN